MALSMRSRWSAALLTLAAAAMANGAGAAEPVTFTIDDYGWEVEQSAERCSARAQLTAGDRAATVELSTTSPISIMRLRVVAQGMGFSRTRERMPNDTGATVRLSQTQAPVLVPSARRLDTPNGYGGAFLQLPSRLHGDVSGQADPLSTDAIATSDGVYLDRLFTRPLVLATGSLGGVMAMLDECTDKLVASWGFDPQQQRALASRPKATNPQEIAEQFQRSLRPGRDGNLNFNIDVFVAVEEDGSVSECRVLPSTAPVDAENACRTIRRHADFEPALDPSGQPVRSYDVLPIDAYTEPPYLSAAEEAGDLPPGPPRRAISKPASSA